MEVKNGSYARAFRRHKEVGKFSPQTLQKWRERLCKASNIAGIEFTGDQGEQLERIAACVKDRLETAKSLTIADPPENRGNELKCFQDKTGYEVFINHSGTDTKEKEASLIFHNLRNKGHSVFPDKNSIQVGDRINTSIEQTIRTASVHIAIFSPNYADSDCCLNELDLIFQTGAPIIPVFCGVSPSEVCMEEENGPYVRAFPRHNEVAKINPQTLEKWRERLREASNIAGIEFTGDQGQQLERIAAACVKACLKKAKPLAVADPPENRGNELKCFQDKTGYEVFINHRGPDTKEKEASLIYHNLRNKGHRVFLDKNSIQVGDRIDTSIEQAICTASIHIAIFSPTYADSDCCLNELDLIFQTGASIIPVFCGVSPSEVCMEEENGPYVRAFRRHKEVAKINPQTLQKWRERLREASNIAGIEFTGDQGEQLERIAAACVKACLEKAKPLAVADPPENRGNELKCFQSETGYEVFINHRGPDTKEKEASLIYHNLRNKGYNIFLDKNSIQVGDTIDTSIEQAIRTASVHIAIFSPNYADSECCLNELDLIFETGAPIIPVFCGVSPSEVCMEEENGPYDLAFGRRKEVAKFNPQTHQKWRERLREASNIAGIEFTGDQREQL